LSLLEVADLATGKASVARAENRSKGSHGQYAFSSLNGARRALKSLRHELDEWGMVSSPTASYLASGRELSKPTGMVDMSAGEPVRVLVVDDHDLFRTGLRCLLEEEGFEVADSSSGPAAIRRAPSFAPDVVVMDMNMPEVSGIEATPLVLEAAPSASVLMLTIATDDSRVIDAVRAGASGYLLKNAELAEIVAGIRAAADGHSAISPRVAGKLLHSVRSSAPETPADPPPEALELSERERAVLALLTKGCDNADIGRRLHVSPSTVKSHVSRVLEKLGVDNRIQAATFAIRHGLEDET
jgi:DNA-binding NarL/FixJ family response regulator